MNITIAPITSHVSQKKQFMFVTTSAIFSTIQLHRMLPVTANSISMPFSFFDIPAC